MRMPVHIAFHHPTYFYLYYDSINEFVIHNRMLLVFSVMNWKRNPLSDRPLQELYYLWRLAGGDLHAELKKQGLVRAKAPILCLPR